METNIKEETKYCAFIDVLGYKNLVMDNSMDISSKIGGLHSLYSNLATQFWLVINEVNANYTDKIFVRSFSDCFYLDCSAIEPLLVAVQSIFTYTFGFYSHFSTAEEKTPLLRCGIVKDWLIKFKDIGALATGKDELNVVGKAVARAYETSELSNLSGMRILLAPEVMEDLKVLHLTIPDFLCYVADIRTYKTMIRYYFRKIPFNEKGDPSLLHELLWPFSRVNDHAYECIDILKKLKPTFPPKAARHFIQTARLFHDTYLLSEWKHKDLTIFERDKAGFAFLACDLYSGPTTT